MDGLEAFSLENCCRFQLASRSILIPDACSVSAWLEAGTSSITGETALLWFLPFLVSLCWPIMIRGCIRCKIPLCIPGTYRSSCMELKCPWVHLWSTILLASSSDTPSNRHSSWTFAVFMFTSDLVVCALSSGSDCSLKPLQSNFLWQWEGTAFRAGELSFSGLKLLVSFSGFEVALTLVGLLVVTSTPVEWYACIPAQLWTLLDPSWRVDPYCCSWTLFFPFWLLLPGDKQHPPISNARSQTGWISYPDPDGKTGRGPSGYETTTL